MVPKYTILKVIIQNFSRVNKTSKGFTLIELIVGLSIMLIVGGLAMDALIQASISFNKDKKNIDSSQSMSAILEIIGSDIKQSGENINDASFPVIKIEKIPTGTANMPGSSRITIRRALTTPLTLCEPITPADTKTTLTVTDDLLPEANCKIGTPVTVGTIIRPTTVKEARNKRCQLDNVNGDYTTPTTSDFCETTKPSDPDDDKERVLAVISDKAGNMRTFQYVDDTSAEDNSGNPTVSGNRYKISISGLSASTATYDIGDPIYLIEERVYSLDEDGNFMLQIDGGTPSKLMKKIQKFNVSARVYGDKETREPDAIDPATPAVKPNLLPKARRCDLAISNYICEFNTSVVDDWKTLQGIKVDLQAKYDGTGQSATATPAELEKLSAVAEFFPRNVLSK